MEPGPAADGDTLTLRWGPEAAGTTVRVRATALNRADLLQRMGMYANPFPEDFEIPGMEFAGTVSSVGSRVVSTSACGLLRSCRLLSRLLSVDHSYLLLSIR